MPVERRGLGLGRALAGASEAGIVDETANTAEGREASKGVACESEGRTRVPVLCALRQGLPARISWPMPMRCAVSNGGAAGVDGETFEAIESRGREAWLGELAQAAQGQALSGRPGTPGVVGEGERRSTAPWNPDDS